MNEFEFIVLKINEFEFEFEFLGRRKNEFEFEFIVFEINEFEFIVFEINEFEFEFHQIPSMNLSLRWSFKILKISICFLNTRLRLFRNA